MSGKRPLVSISIPVLNESGNIEALYARLDALATKMKDRCDLEFVFSDNHSDDDTEDASRPGGQRREGQSYSLSRNYGFQRSILANYMHTKGDAVMQIDADLQDPPEMLEEFLLAGRKGMRWSMECVARGRKVGY